MGKKASRPPASKTSSAASPAASGLTYTGNKSSILKASFAPSEYQLALFASVIQGLDAQHIRIHDTTTGRLQCEHVLGPKETVTSLDWGYYPSSKKDRDQHSKKKRKRHSDINGDGFDQGDVVVAFGTSASEIRMYSPVEDKIVGTLANGHEKGIRDFKFTTSRPGQEGWSIGGDNKLVQWDLYTGQRTRTINLPTTSAFSTLARPLPSNPHVVCASQTPYVVSVEEDEAPITFNAMRNPVKNIITSSTESAATGLFLASDGDRYITVFDVQKRRLAMNLVAENGVSSVSLYTGAERKGTTLPAEKQVVAAVTEDGTIELFSRPFVLPNDQTNAKGAASLKARSKQATRRADSLIKVTVSATSDALVSMVAASFHGPDLVVAWAEGGVVPVFQRIKWLNEETDELLFTGTQKIAKTKSGSVLGSVTVNGTRTFNENQVDESRAVVEQGNIIEDDIEMQDSKDAASVADSEEDSDDDDVDMKQTNESKQLQKKAEADSDVEMGNAQDSGSEEEEEDETGEPSFGELMRANQEVDVEAELEDDVHMGSLVPGKPSAAVQQIPSGVSLSTVLSQSLKTNDNAMLESCFHTGELSIIRSTIQRLDSSLAATLLQKLAERLSARPGRYGHLLVWVQWTCVAHGGALAGKPELLKRMSTLFKVMDQRSSSLPSLLLLKGKLDMLDAQLGLRRSIRSGEEAMESEDEDNIIYVEGQEEDEEDDSDADAKNATTPRTKSIRDQAFDEEESMLNGVQSGDESEDEEEGSEEEEEEDENILDVEAEESAGSSDAEESLEEDEDEDDDDAESAGSMVDFIADTEDEESDEEPLATSKPPPSKKARLSGGGRGKGKNKGRK
ncbi:WD40 repeat and Utp12 domain-containing protein [Aspergillus ibericus CBS 121593]|uniref:Small nucleolar ribonucleo protein complex component n=1 Tax=Aspergillus ibericus CBS 121593 TaxID=1448316 RepID=A0A395H8Z8_9EURO|nr:small nucleolar ribonucleo protein complex component [Aspergillus ibericus CBS 121593]RAL03993.1 small nucleolar ribonucleo protein complex component [Aspergillus ibericus CBS 121593]